MIIDKTRTQRYADELKSRYVEIQSALSGRQAGHDDRFHGTTRGGQWSEEGLKKMVIIDALELNLAIDDLSAILKEIKKLAK